MPATVDVATPGVRIPVSRARVESAALRVLKAERVSDAAVDITFVTSRRMAALNWKHLQHRGTTDVISFGFDAIPGAPVTGDIYIAPDVARVNARASGEPVAVEILRLVVHGTLHILGYEHPVDDGRYGSAMWKRQEQLLARVLATP